MRRRAEAGSVCQEMWHINLTTDNDCSIASENDEACKIVCKHKSEYIVVGSREFVVKKIEK